MGHRVCKSFLGNFNFIGFSIPLGLSASSGCLLWCLGGINLSNALRIALFTSPPALISVGVAFVVWMTLGAMRCQCKLAVLHIISVGSDNEIVARVVQRIVVVVIDFFTEGAVGYEPMHITARRRSGVKSAHIMGNGVPRVRLNNADIRRINFSELTSRQFDVSKFTVNADVFHPQNLHQCW